MAFTYTTRRGQTYYLHTGPKRGGGTQHYVSTDPKGRVADAVPGDFEIYETPNGQVYLRKKKPVLIQPAELALVEKELQKRQTSQHRYLAEIRGKEIVIHEGDMRGRPRPTTSRARRASPIALLDVPAQFFGLVEG